MKLAKISSIEHTEPDEFYDCEIDLPDHGAAIRVYGKDLDECIERAIIIKRAFNRGVKT